MWIKVSATLVALVAYPEPSGYQALAAVAFVVACVLPISSGHASRPAACRAWRLTGLAAGVAGAVGAAGLDHRAAPAVQLGLLLRDGGTTPVAPLRLLVGLLALIGLVSPAARYAVLSCGWFALCLAPPVVEPPATDDDLPEDFRID